MTNVEAAIKKLEPGIMYRIVYKQQLGNYQWYEHEMFAQYIGKGDNDKLLFSLRPLAGTQNFNPANIIGIYEMPRTTQPKLPRRIKRLDHTK
jgi:hypothetical protein